MLRGNASLHECWRAAMLFLLFAVSSITVLAAENEVDTRLFPPPVISTQGNEDIFPGTSSCATNCTPSCNTNCKPKIVEFSVPSYPAQFPNCPTRMPYWNNTAWNSGECDDACSSCEQDAIPAMAIREAKWYVAAVLVPLRRDPQHSINLARKGTTAASPFVLSSQDFDYPFDAGMYFTVGRRLTDRLAVEGSYLGSYAWRDSVFARNADANTQGGTGNLSSPFTNFGTPATVGLDFNNFIQAETTASLESAEINLRYRGEVPCGPWDVSFLYGVRYLHIGETLRYHSESAVPAAQGTQNTELVATGNDMIGAQLGMAGHYLYSPRSWFDIDLKGGIYSNQAKNATVYNNLDNNGVATTFNTNANRADTAFSGDIRLLWNYQLLPRFTVQTGYQATWVTSVATAVDNFQTDIASLKLGPGIIRSSDTVAYHGPVLGLIWVR